jgi:pterin-4a-carbinolamine dehydratase
MEGTEMTERMVEDLHSDVWGIGKSDFTEYTPEEELKEWREAVKVLDGFCQVADGLNHSPLILALVDAKVRAEEELERAREGVQLSPREDERLMDLMRRTDALSNACAAMEDWSSDSPTYLERYLEVLKEMHREASEAFLRYRREVGLPE